LDDWETFINNQPVSEQKRFLSRQTSQGLRVSLRSTRELSQILLQDGFRYVLTGKFNQDPLEVTFSYTDRVKSSFMKKLNSFISKFDLSFSVFYQHQDITVAFFVYGEDQFN
jgi:hypothetical protein